MSCKDGQGNSMQCRASWSNRFAWAAVIAIGILGAAITEGAVVASPDTSSRKVHTGPARSNSLDSHQQDATEHPSQCTANFDNFEEANLVDLEITSASHRALLAAGGKPAHKLSSVLQHMIPHKSFLEVPVPYASPQVAPTSNPSIPSPSAGLQVASPYALPSTPLFSPSLTQPTISSVTPAPTPASTSVQTPTPSPELLPLPSITAVPATTLPPTPGITSTPAGSTAASPTALTASPAVSSSPVTPPSEPTASTASPSPTSVPDGPAVPPSRPAAASSPAISDNMVPTAPGQPSSPATTATSTPTVSTAPPISAVSSPGASSSVPPSQLQFIPIPFGFEPLVTAQATFLAIPASSLTLPQAAEVAADLQQALANVTNGSIPVTAVVTPINVVATAAAPLPSRRHLLQTGNTFQATVLFTATFATAPSSSTAVQAAVQAAVATAVAPLSVATSASSIGSGSYNVTIVFPANNQVSSSASQGTAAATTFLAGLRNSPTSQLASLAASQGSFTVSSSQIQDNLVTLSPGSVSPAAAASPVLSSSSPASQLTPVATSPAASAMTTPSSPADAAPVAEPTPGAASGTVPAAPATSPPTVATPGGSQSPPSPSLPQNPPPEAGQASPPSPPPVGPTPSATPEPTPEATPAPMEASSAASPIPTPDPAEAAPEATPPSPLLVMNLSAAFPPTATAAAQNLASMLFNQSQRDFYAVIARNGPIVFSNVMYGSQPIPIPSTVPAPAPAPEPDTASSAAPAAAAPESAPSSGAAIESFSGADDDESSSAASGQLYAINMQYGVGGARTNALANLLVFSSNSSGPPRATDFAVQLDDPAQTGNVSVLSTYSSSSDYLIRVDCPEGYTGPVTVGYASPTIQAVNYNVIDSALLVKVTASTATQQ